MTHCRVCQSDKQSFLFSADLLNRSVKYFECQTCKYVQTEEPDWLEEAYAATINSSDTGILTRNQGNVRHVLAALAVLGNVSGRVTDFAGGYGILVRMLRDIGIDAYWSDPFCENLVCRGFEDSGERSDLVTAFEAFEHFVDPVKEVGSMLDIAPNILFSTSLIAEPAPPPSEWWYYGLDHGQHVGFFRVQTLEYLAEKFGKNLMTDGNSMHFLTEDKYSPFVWKSLRLLARKMPSLLTRRLQSKTWSDHLAMAERARDE